MPLPTSPTILLAMASMALIFGRYTPTSAKWVWGFFFLCSTIIAGYGLSTETIQAGQSLEEMRIASPWIHDGLAQSEQWLVLFFGTLTAIAIFDSPHHQDDLPNLYGYLLFIVAGLMLVSQSNDFLSLGLSLEIVHLAVTAFARRETRHQRSTESPIQTASESSRIWSNQNWIGWLSSGWMWLGIALLANATATTHFQRLSSILTEAYDSNDRDVVGTPSKLILLASGLISMSLFARMGLIVLKNEDRHLAARQPPGGSQRPSEPVPVFQLADRPTYLTSGIVTQAGLLSGSIALARLLGYVFIGVSQPLTTLIMTLSLVCFMASSVIAVRGFSPGVKSLPKWLKSISLLQSAWLAVVLMIIAAETIHPATRSGAFPDQIETLALFVFVQIGGLLSSYGIYCTLSSLERADREIEFLEDINGLSRHFPFSAVALIVALGSIIGIPLTAGFWGRWLTFLSGSNVHQKWASSIFTPNEGLRVLMFAGALATMTVAVVAIRFAREMFFEIPLARSIPIGGRSSWAVSLVAAFLTMVLGVSPQIALGPLRIIPIPRTKTPIAKPNGSGKNSLSRIDTHSAIAANETIKYKLGSG